MNDLAKQLSDLGPFKLEESIIRQVAAQLAKDFNDIQVEVSFTGSGDPYLELKQQVLPIVDYLLEKNPEKLFALFYRIDIPEQKVKSLFTGEGDAVDEYTELILNRELQKVITRNFYASMS
jgi:hypothetical protein